tara:strand:+ start:150 stop:728 length:579 start_codon:yes stop_codon:yes gene_type:complete
MEIEDVIGIYDEVLTPSICSSILKFANLSNFGEAKVVNEKIEGGEVNKKIRNTNILPLERNSNSMSNVHWFNFLTKDICDIIEVYKKDKKIKDIQLKMIMDMSILKYDTGGFYLPHIDHSFSTPRTLTIIYFLNNDYVGGSLNFWNLEKTKIIGSVSAVPGRVVVFPSNFLFPHQIENISKGTRYTVIAWAL